MQLSRPRKTASNLSSLVDCQLNMYALAAGAAGVGVLAFAQPSEAKIVYTPANVAIRHNSSFDVDLNHDQISDVRLTQVCLFVYHQGGCILEAMPFVGNGVEEGAGNSHWAAALKPGVNIGHAKQFNSDSMVMAACRGKSQFQCSKNYEGYWFYTQARYLGLKFQIKGKTHFGWMRLTNSSPLGANLTGFAYETIPGKSIKAGRRHSPAADSNNEGFSSRTSVMSPLDTPQSAILGALAMGAPGMSLWRRKESASTAM